MVPTHFLLLCALATTQQPPMDRADWQLLPRLERGQELVYRGSYVEEASGPGVQFTRQIRLENRVFVLEPQAKGTGYELAIFTVWKSRIGQAENGLDRETSSVRLELATTDARGRLSATSGASLVIPLDEPPTIECGMFIELPRFKVNADQSWDIHVDGRPPQTWHIIGLEQVNGARCVKVVGKQQSDDWDKPRADHTAWRRQDTVWLAPRSGYALKFERIIERREPARREPTQKAVLQYELESSLQYPGQLFEDRRKEITQAYVIGEAVAKLLPQATQVGPQPFEFQLARIKNHLDRQSWTPYREALLHVQRLADAGRRGEPPPVIMPDATDALHTAPILRVGRVAPDFLVQDLVSKESVRLHRWLGKPIVLVFYTPLTRLGEEALRFAQKIQDDAKLPVHVITLAVTDDPELVMKERQKLRITLPVLAGSGLQLSYRVEGTPKIVVLDAAGVVRNSYIGWGPETTSGVLQDLANCQPATPQTDPGGPRLPAPGGNNNK